MHTRIAFPGGAGRPEKGARGNEGSATAFSFSPPALPHWTSIADGPDYEVCGGPTQESQALFWPRATTKEGASNNRFFLKTNLPKEIFFRLAIIIGKIDTRNESNCLFLFSRTCCMTYVHQRYEITYMKNIVDRCKNPNFT